MFVTFLLYSFECAYYILDAVNVNRASAPFGLDLRDVFA